MSSRMKKNEPSTIRTAEFLTAPAEDKRVVSEVSVGKTLPEPPGNKVVAVVKDLRVLISVIFSETFLMVPAKEGGQKEVTIFR